MSRWFWIVPVLAMTVGGAGLVLSQCSGSGPIAPPVTGPAAAPAPAQVTGTFGPDIGPAGPRGMLRKAPDPHRLQALTARLAPLHSRMGEVQPGDWLSQHREPGQTFTRYLQQEPVHARGKRRVLYIQPIGTFDAPELEVLDLTARFLGAFFCLPVKVLERLPYKAIPASARRKHPAWGDHQILTTYVLDRVLAPRLPDDAATLLALTPEDLWPGHGWNFVFGQASLYHRVGVWSTYRNGDPVKERALHLLRTFKIASHETGHMFTIHHCTAYECGMCGSNNRAESDRRPLAFCPQCLAKLLWATGCDAARRYRSLADLCQEAGLSREAARYRKLLAALEGTDVAAPGAGAGDKGRPSAPAP